MSLLDCMDALQVHAAAAATTAGGATFTDVSVGSSPPKGRCVRIYYGGEREPIYFGTSSLSSEFMAQLVYIDAFWPAPETAAKRNRVMEGQIASFAASLRTRVDGDFQLGGKAVALKMLPGQLDHVVVSRNAIAGSGSEFDRMQFQIGIDTGDEYTWTG